MIESNLKTLLVGAAVILLGGLSGVAWSHCDTESGPVAVDARKALETGKFAPVAIWVSEEQGDDLREAFEQCLSVYEMGGKAKTLAERHFMETAVRLHRQSEGFPYTGLKPAKPLPADVAKAESALENGDLEPVTKLLQSELDKKLTKLFDDTRKTQEDKDKSIKSGREWADAYVKFVIYVHGLYKTIKAGPKHGVGE